jgi:hypothetical protein
MTTMLTVHQAAKILNVHPTETRPARAAKSSSYGYNTW